MSGAAALHQVPRRSHALVPSCPLPDHSRGVQRGHGYRHLAAPRRSHDQGFPRAGRRRGDLERRAAPGSQFGRPGRTHLLGQGPVRRYRDGAHRLAGGDDPPEPAALRGAVVAAVAAGAGGGGVRGAGADQRAASPDLDAHRPDAGRGLAGRHLPPWPRLRGGGGVDLFHAAAEPGLPAYGGGAQCGADALGPGHRGQQPDPAAADPHGLPAALDQPAGRRPDPGHVLPDDGGGLDLRAAHPSG
ncbi:hypothetical protein D3C72_719670 [compost metagenome]